MHLARLWRWRVPSKDPVPAAKENGFQPTEGQQIQPDDHFWGFQAASSSNAPRTNVITADIASDASRFAFDPDGYSDRDLYDRSGTLQQLGVNCRHDRSHGAARKIPAANGGSTFTINVGSPDPVR